jgi:hypothetical protein
MKTVKKQFWFVSLIMLAISAADLHSRASLNADTAIAEPASINSTSQQPAMSASGRVVITLREEGASGPARVTGISGVRITFARVSGTGPVPSPVQTDGNGNWNQSGFLPFEARFGDTVEIRYRATASKAGLAFDPAFLTFNGTRLVRQVANLNFEAHQDLPAVSGKVTTESGRPVPGVTVSVSQGGSARTATTDNQGRWTVTLSGTFSTLRATPSLGLSQFSPSFRDFDPRFKDVARGSASSLDFKLPETFSIRGTLKSDQQGTAPPTPNATVSFELTSGTGARPPSVRSDANGDFSQTGFTTGCTYRIKVVTSSGRVCATRDVRGAFNGRINCL